MLQPHLDNSLIVRRQKFLIIFSLIGISALAVFSLAHFIGGNVLYGSIEMALAIVALGNLLWLRWHRHVAAATVVMLGVMGITLTFLLITGGVGQTGIFWFYTFPLLAYFLQGKKRGSWWMLGIFIVLGAVTVLQMIDILNTPYSLTTLRQLAASLFAVTLLVYFYQQINEHSERALAEHATFLQTLLDNLPVGVFVGKAPKGEPLMVNQAAVALLGRGINPTGGKSDYADVYDIVKEDGSRYPNEELPLPITLNTGKGVTKNDISIRRPDGKTVAIKVSSAPIQDLNGQLTAALVIFEDITREREIDRMKSEFISLASHQLRTPLTAMKWFSKLLLMKDADKLTVEQKEYINNIYVSNERMIDLVNALLNISRIESGRIIIDPLPTKLPELLQGVLGEVKLKADEKKQQVEVNVADSLPIITLDPKLIRQVYLNFLTNAIKYTPEKGTITISITMESDHVVSKVQDTGYGIPAKDQARVWQKFYRGENIVKLGSDGTGLGLYLVKAIVDSSGGSVGFESTEGKGTTFWFKLPRAGSKPKKGEVSLS